MDTITESFKSHHQQLFLEKGATPQGLGWRNEETTLLRYDKMLAVMDAHHRAKSTPPRLLDVGCGYAGLYEYAKSKGIELDYTGIDVCESMISHARQALPEDQYPNVKLECTSVFDFNPETPFDFAVCNGILTQKLAHSIKEMDAYANRLVERMYELGRVGIAFNTMSTKVDFMEPHLYYRNPIEFIGYCYSHLSHYVRLDHAYPLYEYTVYVYHPDA